MLPPENPDHPENPERVEPDQADEEMPLPTDPSVVFLGALFVLALLAALYAAVARPVPVPSAIESITRGASIPPT